MRRQFLCCLGFALVASSCSQVEAQPVVTSPTRITSRVTLSLASPLRHHRRILWFCATYEGDCSSHTLENSADSAPFKAWARSVDSKLVELQPHSGGDGRCHACFRAKGEARDTYISVDIESATGVVLLSAELTSLNPP